MLTSESVVELIERYRAELSGYSTAQIEAVVREQIDRDLKRDLHAMADAGDGWARSQYERHYGPLKLVPR